MQARLRAQMASKSNRSHCFKSASSGPAHQWLAQCPRAAKLRIVSPRLLMGFRWVLIQVLTEGALDWLNPASTLNVEVSNHISRCAHASPHAQRWPMGMLLLIMILHCSNRKLPST